MPGLAVLGYHTIRTTTIRTTTSTKTTTFIKTTTITMTTTTTRPGPSAGGTSTTASPGTTPLWTSLPLYRGVSLGYLATRDEQYGIWCLVCGNNHYRNIIGNIMLIGLVLGRGKSDHWNGFVHPPPPITNFWLVNKDIPGLWMVKMGIIWLSKFITWCELALKNSYQTWIWLSNIITGHLTQADHFSLVIHCSSRPCLIDILPLKW